jgi:hypothetical protein
MARILSSVPEIRSPTGSERIGKKAATTFSGAKAHA